MPVQEIIERLDNVKSTGKNKWLALCPAHLEKTPSLNITELDDGRILMHCFGCGNTAAIMDAIGLSLADLYPEPLDKHIRPLYMARQEKRQQTEAQDEMKSCRLRLEMSDEMRERGIPLTNQDLRDERKAFLRLKELENQNEY